MTDTTKPVEPVAWEGWFEGCGSISSATRHTSHKSIADGWAGKGVKVTPLIPAAALDAARAEIERLNNAMMKAVNQISDLAARLGQAEGRLAASELVGVVEGWKARAEKAEAERDEALAQVAVAYEAAAKTCSLAATNYLGKGADTDLGSRSRAICDVAFRIRALIPADAKAALEAYGREKVREGMQRAADLFKDANHGEHIISAILAAMEKEGGE